MERHYPTFLNELLGQFPCVAIVEHRITKLFTHNSTKPNNVTFLFLNPLPNILHHGAVTGVTGSCHELQVDTDNALLIDCGLFQGEESSLTGAGASHLEVEFPVEHIRALVVTHVHIDHIGRIPYLLAAGFSGPNYCSEPSAILLPLVLEDALKVGFTRNKNLT